MLQGIEEDIAMMLRPPHHVGGRGKAKLDATLELSKNTGFCPLGSHVAPSPGLEGASFNTQAKQGF